METSELISMLISSCVPILVGYVYYSKNLAGKAWRNIFTPKEKHVKLSSKITLIIVSFIMSFLLSFFLLEFNNGRGQEGEFDTFAHGVWHGCFLAIIIAMPITILNGLYEFKKIKILLINLLYWILSLGLMGGIMDAMNHWPNQIT